MKTTGVVIAAVAAVVMSACSSGPYDPNNASEAEAQCEGFADQRLKAPATADYDLDATEDGGGWRVVGTVDSENGFGAKIRSAVTCQLHFVGDTAYLDDISIG